MRAVKNYSSGMPINRIFGNLQKILSSHGAKQILFEYGDDGKIYGVTFIVKVKDRLLPIKLPARIDKATALLKMQYEERLIKSPRVLEPEQVYRIVWRNILDWVDAQMALLDIDMAKLEEIFLPYVTDRTGKTLFEVFEKNQYQLPSGKEGS